ncbi:tumor necrosis factor alpha-induced protein 2a isoform X2 [Toxotes jaculatrix]|uniref:tumor necrosis factor alpha-induced protein 2a isoform X2 n=1 Tax=Toxotes jaculatrix TaxID=941984 RepID=UPI001B3A8AA3|nr:tumor necrosis factor alpha-induced protein 2a isoform X2 [Toxotes jaculatrix]
MWSSVLSTRSQQSSGGGAEENRGGQRRRLPKLKNPAKFWKNSSTRQQNRSHTEENELDCVEEKELLEEVSRRLIIREEQVFSQDCPSEDEDQLQKDFEALKLQILMAIDNTFSTPSSLGHLDVLRSAVASIQQQEVQDRRWTDCSEDRLPVWRPLKCLSSHNSLLQNIVDSRLKTAAEDELTGPDRLSSPVKREVCRMGTRVKEDLLVVRTMRDCYPPQMDILNVYAGLYHQGFSARLMELAASGLDIDDCSYLLFWVNHFYPDKILKHEDLDGQIKTVCLGSLLLQDHLKQLEEQYLSHKEDKVKLWLSTALKKEEESWLSGRKPELIDSYYFSPLAVDVIQVIDSSLTEFSHVIRDQSRIQRITAHLDSFLGSYKKSVEEFMKGNHSNICSVVKAHLVCEEQLRDYITTGSLPEQQRRRCLDTLSALRDCGYRYLTCPIHVQLKVCYKNLWTPDWLDASPPVVISLLDSLNEHLMDLTDLKPACRQSLLGVLHQDVALQYVKRMMKNRMKSREQQQAGAQKMKEDVQTMDDFFKDQGCSESSWFSKVLCSVAEVLRLQDPGSVHLEMVSLARTCPDLSNAHVSALLSLKIGLSSADMRSIRQSLEENRLLDVSTNHSPPFFSKVKVKWISNKINQMGL